MNARADDQGGPWVARLRSPWARPILFTTAVILLLIAQTVGSTVYGDLRTPAEVSAQLGRQGSADVAVVLDFAPEQFHLDYLQGLGNIVQSSGDTIYMTGLTSSAVRDIAGQYWVASVLPWNGG